VLIGHLPMDSWTQTALRDSAPQHDLTRRDGDESFGPWDLSNYQLAALTDAVSRVGYLVAVAGHLEPTPKPPAPTPRPGAARSKVRAIPPAAEAYLNRLRAKGA
jgi:hypothetical protein